MKKVIIALVFIALLTACSKKDSTTPNTTYNTIKCFKKYNSSGTLDLIDTFAYDASNRLISVTYTNPNSDSLEFRFKYNVSSQYPSIMYMLSRKIFYTSTHVDTFYMFYDAQNRITSINNTNNTANLNSAYFFSYNANTIYTKKYDTYGMILELDTTTLTNGNVTFSSNYYSSSSSYSSYTIPINYYTANEIAPMYNPAIANSFGIFFIVGQIGTINFVDKNAYNYSLFPGFVVTRG